MLVEEVDALFLTFVDEDDPTFLSAAQRSVIHGRGYARFRRIVSTYDPHFYAVRVNIVPAADNYNLSTAAVRIMGNNLTTTRLSGLVRVEDVDGAGDHLGFWRGAASWDELRNRTRTYLLESVVLYFHSQPSGTVRLTYVPVSAVSWANLAAGGNVFIDELDEFHDLIALLGARYYSVQDVAKNTELDQLLAERLGELERYLVEGRARQMGDHVQRVPRR